MSTAASWMAEFNGSRVADFYSRLGVQLKGDSEASVRCFANPSAHAHNDKTASCSVNLGTGLFHCKACGAKGNAFGAAKALRLDDRAAAELAKEYGLFLEKQEKPKLPTVRRTQIWCEGLQANKLILGRLAQLKGWTPTALRSLQVGWDGERLTFPIFTRQKLSGCVRYLPGGSPKTLAVGKRDLFPDPDSFSRSHTVFLCEGEPDAISVWSCGLHAVGIPGTGSWKPEWAMRFTNRKVVMLADADQPGRDLAQRVQAAIPNLKVVNQWQPFKDVGDWVAGASSEGGLRQMTEILGAFA